VASQNHIALLLSGKAYGQSAMQKAARLRMHTCGMFNAQQQISDAAGGSTAPKKDQRFTASNVRALLSCLNNPATVKKEVS
jgi:hypothetical protein